MMRMRGDLSLVATLLCLLGGFGPGVLAGDLVVELGKSEGVGFVGAQRRWTAAGQQRSPVDPKARIDAPAVVAEAERIAGNRWLFRGLPPGRYDLVILAAGHVRVEGFHYPPIAELDPFLSPTASPPEEEVRQAVVAAIARSRHYENRVSPLFLAGDGRQVRVLMQLVRDQTTSYDAAYGAPVATIRHEVWQYTNHYGGWTKERRTAVLDRVLLAKAELGRWTWVWEPRLGGIEVGEKAVRIVYELPDRFESKTARGWFPY